MKRLLKMLSVSVGTVFGCWVLTLSAQESEDLIPPPPIKPKNSIESGKWKFTESFTTNYGGKSQADWDVELIDDGSTTTIALGNRLSVNGAKIRYRSEAILVIDRHDNDEITGLYFEVDQNGQQILNQLKVSVSDFGKSLSIVAVDPKSQKQKATFTGKWVEIPSEHTPLKKGNWTFRETVSPDQGGYNIVWSYDLDESKGDIYGSGRKTYINGRRAHPNERETVCNIHLKRQQFKPNIIKGTGTEKSPHAKTFYAAYDGWISPTGERFVVFSYENKELMAIIVGEFNK